MSDLSMEEEIEQFEYQIVAIRDKIGNIKVAIEDLKEDLKHLEEHIAEVEKMVKE